MQDPTEFRKRFQLYKEGKMPYENGLPKYAEGTPSYDSTVEFLKKHEGFKDTTYLDGNGIPTIGYGFTDSSLVKKGTISRAEADRRLKQEVAARESVLSKMKNWDNLSEDSKTALRSYYYNYPAGFKPTTRFMKAWNAGNYEEAIRQVDAGMNDKNNPGLRKRRLEEQALLKADPFLRPVQTIQPTPIVNQPVSTAVRPIIKEEQTVPAYDPTISPYISGKPMVKLRPRVQLPNLIELMEDSEWEPGFPGLKNGKLPCFEMGTPEGVDMGEKRSTPISIEQVRNTPHEQGMSGTDPIGKFVVESVGMTKGAKILGDILSAARLRRMADTYRNLRKYDQDIQNYTGKSLRKQNMQFADKIARDGFLYSRPENPLYWILDPIMAGYTKLQSHPVIGPLIPFKNGKIPEYKNGKSPIHIKPANRGKFTALKKRTGHSASWFKENGTPAQKKMAVFALNAKKWKH